MVIWVIPLFTFESNGKRQITIMICSLEQYNFIVKKYWITTRCFQPKRLFGLSLLFAMFQANSSWNTHTKMETSRTIINKTKSGKIKNAVAIVYDYNSLLRSLQESRRPLAFQRTDCLETTFLGKEPWFPEHAVLLRIHRTSCIYWTRAAGNFGSISPPLLGFTAAKTATYQGRPPSHGASHFWPGVHQLHSSRRADDEAVCARQGRRSEGATV